MAQILVIDDEALVRLTARQCLEMAGHTVIEAKDGNEGIKSLRTETPDLIITDLIMPEMEGVETVVEIRRTHGEVPIIAISGGGRVGPENFLQVAKHLGANRTLQKPFTPEELTGLVAELLAKRED